MKILLAALLSVAFIWLAPAKQANSDINNIVRKPANVEQTRKVATEDVAPLQEKTPEQAPAKNLSEPVAQPVQGELQRSQTIAVPQTVPDTPKSIAQAKAAQRGWTGAEWIALDDLWHKESGWKPDARNKSSGACGIPQAYPCSKIPNPNSVDSQIEWGLEYIAKRYSTPSKALAFWHNEAPKYNGSNWY